MKSLLDRKKYYAKKCERVYIVIEVCMFLELTPNNDMPGLKKKKKERRS